MSHADDVDVEILKQLKAMDSNSKKEPDHELDEESVYAQSVAATLRNMTPEQREMAKIKIQQILYEIQYCMPPQSAYLENYHSVSNDY